MRGGLTSESRLVYLYLQVCHLTVCELACIRGDRSWVESFPSCDKLIEWLLSRRQSTIPEDDGPSIRGMYGCETCVMTD